MFKCEVLLPLLHCFLYLLSSSFIPLSLVNVTSILTSLRPETSSSQALFSFQMPITSAMSHIYPFLFIFMAPSPSYSSFFLLSKCEQLSSNISITWEPIRMQNIRPYLRSTDCVSESESAFLQFILEKPLIFHHLFMI